MLTRRSRRFAVRAAISAAAVILFGTAQAAAADQPFRLGPFSQTVFVESPAGLLCDFQFRGEGTWTTTVSVFPQDGRVKIANVQTTTYTNLDTGYSLHETIHFNNFGNISESTLKTTGVQFHLRDPDGKVVAVEAGYSEVDFVAQGDTVVVKITPHLTYPPGDVLCEALGGSPA